MNTATTIYTIGHSAHAFETFHALLSRHEITAIADVRSAPYSRHAPQYCKEDLQRALEANSVSYVFLGQQLGARPKDERCYIDGKVSYAKIAETDAFRAGIGRVLDGAARFRIALMCAERDPVNCHRTILVSKALTEQGAAVQHILMNGELESHKDTMLRVADLVGLPPQDLLRDTDDIIAEAYQRRSDQVSYRRK
ncbi:MAG: DUF488 domain-containing protein [Pseudomonadota bacterium]